MEFTLYIKGRRRICALVGIKKEELQEYVEKHGLPAAQFSVNGTWRASPEALAEWAKQHVHKLRANKIALNAADKAAKEGKK